MCATKIGIELRNQYVLGYRPNNPAKDGKWRKIKEFKTESAKRSPAAARVCQDGILCTYGIDAFAARRNRFAGEHG